MGTTSEMASTLRFRYMPNRRGVRLTTGVPTPAILGVLATLLAALCLSAFSCLSRSNSSFKRISASDSVLNCCLAARRWRSEKCCSRTVKAGEVSYNLRKDSANAGRTGVEL